MNRTRLLVMGVVLAGLVAVVTGFSHVEGDARQLQILLEDNGQFTEWTFELTTNELLAYFPENLVRQLLDGAPLHVTSGEDLEGVWDLVDPGEGAAMPKVFILYAQDVPATWTCVKCCFADPPLACCCKPKEPDDVADGNNP